MAGRIKTDPASKKLVPSFCCAHHAHLEYLALRSTLLYHVTLLKIQFDTHGLCVYVRRSVSTHTVVQRLQPGNGEELAHVDAVVQ